MDLATTGSSGTTDLAVADAEEITAGWLFKQVRSGLHRGRWHRRWFHLRGAEDVDMATPTTTAVAALCWYANRDGQKGRRADGRHLALSADSTADPHQCTRSHCFRVGGRDTELVLAAASGEEKEMWLAALRCAIGSVRVGRERQVRGAQGTVKAKVLAVGGGAALPPAVLASPSDAAADGDRSAELRRVVLALVRRHNPAAYEHVRAMCEKYQARARALRPLHRPLPRLLSRLPAHGPHRLAASRGKRASCCASCAPR